MYQDIIAAQAPKLNMFSGFWQLVLDQNVTAIGMIHFLVSQLITYFSTLVMITKLTEDGKVKADQYWPSKVGKKLIMDNKISVKFMSEVAEVDGIIRRSFDVKLEGLLHS